MKIFHFTFYEAGRLVGYLQHEYEDMWYALENHRRYHGTFMIMERYPDIDRIEIQQEG